LNNVVKDARVLRAARCLRDAGHEITIFGVREASMEPQTVHIDDLRIRRFGTGRRLSLGMSKKSTSMMILPNAQPPNFAPAHGVGFGNVPEWLFTLLRSNRPFRCLRRKSAVRRHKAMYRQAIELRPDLIHAHDINTLPLGVAAAQKMGVPIIFDAHEIYDQRHVNNPKQEETRRHNSYMLARYGKFVDGFVTLTPDIANYYKKTYKDIPNPTIVGNATKIVNGIYYDGRLHKAAGFAADTRIILYQGRYSEMRCLAELIDAAEHLEEGWGIVTLGYGPTIAAMLDRIGTLSPAAQARIRVLDAVPEEDLPYWTAGATLGYLALPTTHMSYWLASPNRLWSYPQAGVPILGTPFPELERVVRTYGLGFLLNGGVTGAKIAEVVSSITEQDFAKARAGCTAFMRAEGWDAHAERLRTLVDRLTAGGVADAPVPRSS
jgi:glycosyltransferase involved in cell wall biosynthesis